MPSQAEYYVDQPLTDLAFDYKNSAFVADLASPRIEVDKSSGLFYKTLRADVAKQVDDKIGRFSEPNLVDWGMVRDSFDCRDRGLASRYPAQQLIDQDAAALDPDTYGMEFLIDLLDLQREIRVADLLDTNTNYATSNRFTAAAAWADKTNGDPIADLLRAARAIPGDTGDDRFVTRVIIEETLFHTMIQHPKVEQKLSANSEGLADKDQIARWLRFAGVGELVVPRSEKNTASEPLTASMARVWDTDKVRIVRVPKEPLKASVDASGAVRIRGRSFIGTFTLRYGGLPSTVFEIASMEERTPFTILKRVHEPKVGGGAGSVWLAATRCEDDVVVQNDMGSIITGC